MPTTGPTKPAATKTPAAAPALITVEHTFTPAHVLLLRDTLAEQVRNYDRVLNDASATRIAEGILYDNLANLPQLNEHALAAGPRHRTVAPGSTVTNETICTDTDCTNDTLHAHGANCGDRCPCEQEA